MSYERSKGDRARGKVRETAGERREREAERQGRAFVRRFKWDQQVYPTDETGEVAARPVWVESGIEAPWSPFAVSSVEPDQDDAEQEYRWSDDGGR